MQLRLVQDRVLPDLEHNIKCGNSLIGPNFYATEAASGLGNEELLRINPFDWQAEFPQVMKVGGFDAVIGNPPYIRIQTMKEWASVEVEEYKRAYIAASQGNYDIYVVFVERGLSLLNRNGLLGFILPHKFFNAQYGEPLRGLLAKGKHLAGVVHFGHQQVFEGATTYTCLLFLGKGNGVAFKLSKVENLLHWRKMDQAIIGTISTDSLTSSEWNFTIGDCSELFSKLNRMPVKLGDVAHLFVGLQTDGDDIYILKEIQRDGDYVLCSSKATGKQHWFENDHLKPFLKGSLNIKRYCLDGVTKRLIFPYEMRDGKSTLIDAQEYCQRYPLTWAYLEENRAL